MNVQHYKKRLQLLNLISKVLWLICIAFIMQSLSSCSKSPEKQIEKRVQTMAETGELGTVEYTIRKIIKTNDKQWYKYGDRKILFVSTAFLKAGINLDGFSANNVVIDGKNATVTLPHAELLSFNMPAEETQLAWAYYSTFRDEYKEEERNQILRLGEQNILEAVPELGILQDAEKNAEELFTTMLTQMGFEKVNIVFDSIQNSHER